MIESLSKIARFFCGYGMNVNVCYKKDFVNSQCSIHFDGRTADIVMGGKCEEMMKINNLDEITLNSIEFYENEQEKEEFGNVDLTIRIFLHELSHALTMTDRRLISIHKKKMEGFFINEIFSTTYERNICYSKLMSEKIADNLSFVLYKRYKEEIYEMYYNNKNLQWQNSISSEVKNMVNEVKKYFMINFSDDSGYELHPTTRRVVKQ